MQQVTRTALPHFNRESPMETARMGHLVRAQTGLHLIGVLPDGRAIVSDDPTELPAVEVHQALSQGTEEKTLSAARVKGAADGLDLVRWNRDTSEVTYARLMPLARDLRSLFAGERFTLHRVEAYPVFSADEARLEAVITRLPLKEVSPDRRATALSDIAALIPGYTSGWKMTEDTWTGLITFTYGVPRGLPDRVPLTSLLPAQATDSTWRCFPMGESADGTQVIYDSEDGVHAIVTGPTGSGKSVLLRSMMVLALANGSEIVIMDGSPKQGLDFLRLKDYAVGWAGEPVSAAALLDSVYDEMKRRANVLPQYDGVTNWHELPAEVREREGIRQLVVFIDEAAALMLLKDLKGLDKNDPKVAAAIAVNQAKTNFKMTLDDLAREARFVDIRLILGFQRPDASIIDGPTRANFPTMIQLKTPGKPLKQESLRMVFPGDDLPLAEAEFRALDNGKPGLAVAMQDGGDVVGFRVAFAHPDELPPLLAERGIRPTGRRLTPAPAAAPAPAAPAQTEPTASAAPAAWR